MINNVHYYFGFTNLKILFINLFSFHSYDSKPHWVITPTRRSKRTKVKKYCKCYETFEKWKKKFCVRDKKISCQK